MNPGPHDISETFVHLSDGGGAHPLAVDAQFWPKLMGGEFAHLGPGRLFSCFTFSEAWAQWERHPNGDELVFLLSGEVELVMENGGEESRVLLSGVGSYVLVPKGVWHRADTNVETTMLFITPGEGTEHRAR